MLPEVRQPPRDVQGMLGPGAGEVFLALLRAVPGVHCVVLVAVAVELEKCGRPGAVVFQPGDLRTARRLAVPEGPAKGRRVLRAVSDKRLELDPLRVDQTHPVSGLFGSEYV